MKEGGGREAYLLGFSRAGIYLVLGFKNNSDFQSSGAWQDEANTLSHILC